MNQSDRVALNENSEVIADHRQRLFQGPGRVPRAEWIGGPLEHPQYLSPHLVPHRGQMVMHLQIWISSLRHLRLLGLGLLQTDRFSSQQSEYWVSIDRIMDKPPVVCPLDDSATNRDDPVVADESKRIAKAFGAKLFAARQKAGLTQEELGARSDVNFSQISQLEQGNFVPRLTTLLRLAGGLEIEPCELMGDVRYEAGQPAVPGKGRWVDV